MRIGLTARDSTPGSPHGRISPVGDDADASLRRITDLLGDLVN
jgi:hypothetical protein